MSLLNNTANSGDKQDDRDFGNWLAGFVDAEGFFVLDDSVSKARGRAHRRAKFGITLRQDDHEILNKIRAFLGCGKVYYHKKGKGTSNPTACFSVSDSNDLADVVIPVFEKYQLRAKKARDFEIWKKGVLLHRRVKQRPFTYLGWKHGKRLGSLPKWTAAEGNEFHQLCEELDKVRKYVEPCGVVEPFGNTNLRDFGNWVAGFTAGEGCFDMQACKGKDPNGIATFRFKVRYDELPIIVKIMQFFRSSNKVSRIEREGNNNPRAFFQITGASNLAAKVIDLFDFCPIRAKKKRDYELWREGVLLLQKIKDRPRIGRTDGGKGYFPKWTPAERQHFAGLCNDLKKTRSWQGTK